MRIGVALSFYLLLATIMLAGEAHSSPLTPAEQAFVDLVQEAQQYNITLNLSREAAKRNVSLDRVMPYITSESVNASTSPQNVSHSSSELLRANKTIKTALHIVSKNKASAVDLALTKEDKGITYAYLEFYLYAEEPGTRYKIMIDRLGTGENVTIIDGTINRFSALETYDVRKARFIKEIRVVIGTDVYTFSNIRVLHKAITKDIIEKSQEEVTMTSWEWWKERARIFSAVFVGSLLAMLASYIIRKHQKENSIEEVV